MGAGEGVRYVLDGAQRAVGHGCAESFHAGRWWRWFRGVGGWRRWDDVRGVVCWEERSVEYLSR